MPDYGGLAYKSQNVSAISNEEIIARLRQIKDRFIGEWSDKEFAALNEGIERFKKLNAFAGEVIRLSANLGTE